MSTIAPSGTEMTREAELPGRPIFLPGEALLSFFLVVWYVDMARTVLRTEWWAGEVWSSEMNVIVKLAFVMISVAWIWSWPLIHCEVEKLRPHVRRLAPGSGIGWHEGWKVVRSAGKVLMWLTILFCGVPIVTLLVLSSAAETPQFNVYESLLFILLLPATLVSSLLPDLRG